MRNVQALKFSAVVMFGSFLGGCSGAPSEAEAHRVELELVGTRDSQSASESLEFVVEASQLSAVLETAAALDEPLSRIEDSTAQEGAVINVELDGEPLLERKIPLSAVMEAAAPVDSFIESLETAEDNASAGDGIGQSRQKASSGTSCGITCRLLGWLGGSEGKANNATIGVRG